jgi:hypothetical protein
MVDVNQLVRQLNTAVNNFIAKARAYFKSLTQYETYAWIGVGVGFVMVMISLITW